MVISAPLPQVSYAAPKVAIAQPVANTPSVAYTPTAYIANPAANPEPIFFSRGGLFGMNGYTSNNLGGKVS